MRKILIYFFAIIVLPALLNSCRKNTSPIPTGPGGGGEEPVHPVPVIPKLVETDPAILSPVSVDISGNIKGFYKALPARYHESNETYPLMIHFHGGGQYGNGTTDLDEVLTSSVMRLVEAKTFPPSFTVNEERFSFIILAPQFVRFPSNTDIDALLEYAKTNLRIDTTRIYLVGFSLGARAAGEYAAYKPGKIAALMSMGGLIPVNTSFSAKCQAMVDAKLPVWHIHNRDDKAWYYSEAVQFIDTLNSFNPTIPPRFTTFDKGLGKSQHDCWNNTVIPTYTEDGKNMYEWMLGYKR